MGERMDAKDLIGHISGGKVLDVATGNGGFIHFLLEGLRDYEEIIGVDTKEGIEVTFAEKFANQPIRYRQMDAAQLEFADESFNTVCISNSLHHMPDLPRTLSRMLRVLKPSGYLIVSEMYRDNQTETQLTHVLLHHWWAAVDRTQGICHNETFRREEIVEMVTGLGLSEMRLYDIFEPAEDPHDPEILAELNPVIERYIQRADGHPDLQERGKDLRQRLEKVGFDGATTLLMTGRKAG
jgi:ubiquinone/menaquinone biosynthesis C-methylase UbiE